MQTKMKTLAIVLAAVVIIAGVGIALSNNGGQQNETISIQGSTTVNPIMLKVQEVYEDRTGVTMNITSNGSGTGAAAALNGTADVAMLSRDLKSSETAGGLVQTVIGLDGVAVIMNSSVEGVDNITLEQLAAVFGGDITNWKEVGGPDMPINVVSREESSGTREAFDTVMKKTDADWQLIDMCITQASTNGIITTVDNTDGSIGYISIGYTPSVGSNTTVLTLDGVEAIEANVVNGTYAIYRNLILATMGEPTGAPAALIDFIVGAEGQKIVAEEGFIPVLL